MIGSINGNTWHPSVYKHKEVVQKNVYKFFATQTNIAYQGII